MLIVLNTAPTLEEAENLAQTMVEARLAACVQVVPRITSFYFWDNQIQKDGEHLLLIKTLPEKYAELEKFILAHHSYEVPEIVALASDQVSDGYLNWLADYLKA